MEAKARHTSILQQKIDFLINITNQINLQQRRIRTKNKLTDISEIRSYDTCRTIGTSMVKIQQKQVSQNYYKNWKTTKRPCLFPHRIKKLEQNTQNKTQMVNWNHISLKNQRIITSQLKKRINKFKNSSFIIQSTLRKMKSQQNSVLNFGLEQYNLKIDQ